MFKKIMKTGFNALKEKGKEVMEIREQLEGMSDTALISMFKNHDFSSTNLAIGAELKDRGYSLVNGRWEK